MQQVRNQPPTFGGDEVTIWQGARWQDRVLAVLELSGPATVPGLIQKLGVHTPNERTKVRESIKALIRHQCVRVAVQEPEPVYEPEP